MFNFNLITPTARQTYALCFVGKVLMFWIFLFWTNASITKQPMLQGDKWGCLILSAILSFGIVYTTLIAIKDLMEPGRIGFPPLRAIVLATLAILASATDVYLVHLRLEAQSVNFLTSGNVSDSGALSYLLSCILLLINVVLSIAMAKAYYEGGLHREAKAQSELDAQTIRERKRRNRQAFRERMIAAGKVLKAQLTEQVENASYVLKLRENERKANAARKAAEISLEIQEAEQTRLKALAKAIENDQLLRNLNSRHPGANALTTITINGAFEDVADEAGTEKSQDHTVTRFPNRH